MRPSKLALASLLVFLVIASTATAAAKPPKLYKGTVTGTQVTKETDPALAFNPVVVTDTWEVTGLKLKRISYGDYLGGKRSYYKVTGGKVHWTQVATGRCTHSIEQSFSLGKNVDPTSAPFGFDKYRGPWKIFGQLFVTNSYPVTITCTTFEGDQWTYDTTTGPPALFSVGDKSKVTQSPARRIKRTFKGTVKTSYVSGTASWKLDVKR